MDRIDELRVLVAISKEMSLTAAARHLGMSKSNVSRALASLEARIGAKLIVRTTRHAALTQTGETVLQHAEAALEKYGVTLGSKTTATGGRVRVTAPRVFGRRFVAPIVSEFASHYPEAVIDLHWSDRLVDLSGEGIDLAVRIGSFAGKRMVTSEIGTVREVLIASPVYLAEAGSPSTLADLAKHTIVSGRPHRSRSIWERSAAGYGRVRVRPKITVNDVETTLALVRDGAGIASALSYQVHDDNAAGRLVELLPETARPVSVYLISSDVLALPHIVLALRNELLTAFASLPRSVNGDFGPSP